MPNPIAMLERWLALLAVVALVGRAAVTVGAVRHR